MSTDPSAMLTALMQVFLDRIVYIGDGVPESLVHDDRAMFVLLGTPQQFLDAVADALGISA
jgi:hypothetical protein